MKYIVLILFLVSPFCGYAQETQKNMFLIGTDIALENIYTKKLDHNPHVFNIGLNAQVKKSNGLELNVKMLYSYRDYKETERDVLFGSDIQNNTTSTYVSRVIESVIELESTIVKHLENSTIEEPSFRHDASIVQLGFKYKLTKN